MNDPHVAVGPSGHASVLSAIPAVAAPTVGAVCWAAIFAGAAAAAALSMILLVLGTGLGLSSVSPWVREGISATTFGVSTIAWLTFTQLAASAIGGYIAGRLRTKWIEAHRDEVFFRDTAHGFLAWAVASLVTAALLTATITTILSGGARAGATVATAAVGATAAATASADSSAARNATAYFVDSLFRRDASAQPSTGPTTAGAAAELADPSQRNVALAEVSRIFSMHILGSGLPPEDLRHVAQLVAQRTGLSQPEAEQRVTSTFTRMQSKLRDAETMARQIADEARKASSHAALWLFASLLIGAFIASLSATWGGRRRDL